MIKRTTTLAILLLGSAIAAISQTNAQSPEVKKPTKSEKVYPGFQKPYDSEYGILSQISPDFDPSFRLQKPILLPSFKSFKETGTTGIFFYNAGLATHNPLAFDFNNVQTNKLDNWFFVISNGQKVTLPGLGEYTKLSSSLGWQPSKKLTINAGGFVGRQFAFATSTPQDIMGATIKIKYNITDRVKFNSWGQYANSGDSNSLAGFNNLFPHSGIGSSVTVKIKNLSKIEGGVEYQYNESTKVWSIESQGKLSLHF